MQDFAQLFCDNFEPAGRTPGTLLEHSGAQKGWPQEAPKAHQDDADTAKHDGYQRFY